MKLLLVTFLFRLLFFQVATETILTDNDNVRLFNFGRFFGK